MLLVICPAARYIEWETEECLRALLAAGASVYRAIGSSDIAQARSVLAARALAGDFGACDAVLWLDSDQTLSVAGATQLLSHGLDMVTAVAPHRQLDRLLLDPLTAPEEVVLGAPGLLELRACGFGSVVTTRAALEGVAAIAEGTRHGWPASFLPLVVEGEYLAEDYAFCHRARAAGFRIFADLSVESGHVGRTLRTWKDAACFEGTPKIRLA